MKKTMLISLMLLISMPLWVHAQKDPDKKIRKQELANRAFEATKSLIESGTFLFWADRLISNQGYSKSLVTTPNSIRIKDGEGDISLPYFGVVRANSPYQVDGGIKYEGALEDYRVEVKNDKRKIIIRFNIDRGIEDHNFMMEVGKDGATRVIVISSGRTTISYYGHTQPVEESTGF